MSSKLSSLIAWLVTVILGIAVGTATINYFKTSQGTHKLGSSMSQRDRLKEERWDLMEKEVARWTDGLGMPIDKGIQDMVIVLNLLGFKTEQSCEGHDNWGRPYPWVRISTTSSELEKLWTQMKSLSEEIQKKENESAPQDTLHKLYRRHHELDDTIQATSLKQVKSLYRLISDFYTQHFVSADRLLLLSRMGFDAVELYSQGGEWQVTRTPTERQHKLKDYQEEMDAFRDFLIRYYYTS